VRLAVCGQPAGGYTVAAGELDEPDTRGKCHLHRLGQVVVLAGTGFVVALGPPAVHLTALGERTGMGKSGRHIDELHAVHPGERCRLEDAFGAGADTELAAVAVAPAVDGPGRGQGARVRRAKGHLD